MKQNYVDIPVTGDYTAAAALAWAKQHCPSYITNDGVYDEKVDQYLYRFYFGQEQDQIIFALRWL